MKNIWAYIVAITLAAAAACAGPGTPSAGESETVIHNPEYGTHQQQNPPAELERIATFESESEEHGVLFSRALSVKGPVTDERGNVYAIDSGTSKFVSFDPEGGIRWVTGQKGSGPGDFLYPRGLAFHDDILYTVNNRGTRLDQFDTEGNLVQSTALEAFDLRNPGVAGVTGSGQLVLTSSYYQAIGIKATVLDPGDTLNIISEFEIDQTGQAEVPPGMTIGPDTGVFGNFITAGNKGKYSILFYDIQGDTARTVNRNFNRLVRPGFYSTNDGAGQVDLGGVSRFFPVDEEYMIARSNWPVNITDPDAYMGKVLNRNAPKPEFMNSIDLFGRDGTLLFSFESQGIKPEIGEIRHADGNGHIFTVAESPAVEIRKYRLVRSGK